MLHITIAWMKKKNGTLRKKELGNKIAKNIDLRFLFMAIIWINK